MMMGCGGEGSVMMMGREYFTPTIGDGGVMMPSSDDGVCGPPASHTFSHTFRSHFVCMRTSVDIPPGTTRQTMDNDSQ